MDLTDIDFEKDLAKFMDRFVGTIQFAEIGEGNLNIPAIIDAGLESGAQYFLVEQDEHTAVIHLIAYKHQLKT